MSDDKHPSITDFQDLVASHRRQEQQLRGITGTLDGQQSWINETTVSLKKITAAVEENTELTRDIKDAITAGKVAGSLMKWLAGAVVTGSAAWLALKGLFK